MRNSRSNSHSPMHVETEENKKSKHTHPKFNSSHHQGTIYLQTHITPHPTDETRYICTLCQSRFQRNADGFTDNLKSHLGCVQHKKTYEENSIDEERCKLAISFLGVYPDPAACNEILQQELELNDGNAHEHPIIQRTKSSDPMPLKFDTIDFLINNNLPFSLGSKLLEFMQSLLQKYEPKTLLEAKLDDHFVSQTTRECGSYIQDQIFSHLQHSPFSISVDEGRDKARLEYLAVSATYYPYDVKNKVLKDSRMTSFLGLIELGTSYEGEVLYEKLTKFLFDRPGGASIKKNLIGICSDHAPNMISDRVANQINPQGKGLCNRLKNDFPYIFVIHDYAHAFNLVIEEGVSKFPPHVIPMIDDICVHFSRSPQRKAELREIQDLTEKTKDLEVLRYVPTRWFSLLVCTNRIITLWQELQIYFYDNGTDKQKHYFTEENLAYLVLLHCILGKLNFYNEIFQSESLTTYHVLTTLKECLSVCAGLIVKLPPMEAKDKFAIIYAIDFSKQDQYSKNLKPFEEFQKFFVKEYPICEEVLTEHRADFKKKFFQTAIDSIVICLDKMKYWLPYKETGIFDSDVLYFKDGDPEKWERLKERFTNIITKAEHSLFQTQLRSFEHNYNTLKEELGTKTNALDVLKSYGGQYSLLYRLSKALMVMPYSSCNIERVFSEMTDIKTLKRNKLGIRSLESCLLIKQNYGDKSFSIAEQKRQNSNESQAHVVQDTPSVSHHTNISQAPTH